MQIKIDAMPASTRSIFEKINTLGGVDGGILIGGTAMALQCGHRLSEGLDFWFPEKSLRQSNLDFLLDKLADSCRVELIMPQSDIVKAKINGFDLLASARDYLIDGVKVTFFHRKDSAHIGFSSMPVIKSGAIAIMSEEGIFNMKSYVITRRVKSRDLFDLRYFVLQGKSLSDILQSAKRSTPNEFSEEVIKATLTGKIPLDKNDEGLYSVSDQVTIGEIYDFFKGVVNDHERSEFLAEAKASPGMFLSLK
jgi:hypothetical protein